MFKQLSTLLLTSSVMLSGCYLERDINYTRPEQPLVKKRTISQLIHYKPRHRIKLTAKEISELKDKVEQAHKVQDIHINIISEHLKITRENTKTKARVNYLIRVLTRLGVPSSSIQTLDQGNWPNSEVKWEPETIVIEIEWYDRHAVHCPGWNQIMDGHVAPEGEENFGCTSKSNLAKMVADPKDLIVGKDLESSDAQYNYMSIERYHSDKIKEIKIEKINDDGA
jgi:pilus biogenesis lipoprotein CpaD